MAGDPQSPEETSTALLAKLSASDQIKIYAEVVRQVTGPDDTFGGELDPPVVFVVRYTHDQGLGASVPSGESTLISPEVQDGILAVLGQEAFRLTWVDSADEVRRSPFDGRVEDGGVIVTLGNLYEDVQGDVLVAGGIYIANMAAGSSTYVVESSNGRWVITGVIGPRVVS